eukprot:CAMPEP_0181384024 /NCGR_PEP_ID=MMETSP1106-20121128/21719_1 /TAXON_ID=81844 /ORGANISM="Mantoniella antarctica, Strain SL-175" /LENGTH=39 /DNA_ID= /DNA_START= /DNA_END= /DNA_ORIENTATION=
MARIRQDGGGAEEEDEEAREARETRMAACAGSGRRLFLR